MSAKQKKPEIAITSANKCSFCQGSKCCVYITQELDTPRTMEEFDHLLWQLAHKDVQLYKDEDGWFLLVLNRCQFLLASGGCGIYETRPQVCREYSNDYCEYDAPPEESFEYYFRNYQELDDYCRQRFKKWDKRFKKWAKKELGVSVKA